jgi:hypothetical protein
MHRQTSLTAIALSPLRAIERTRGWRRLGLLVLYGMIALVIWALLWRRSQLAAVPDIGNPFERTAVHWPDRAADARNALAYYEKAAERFRYMNDAEGASFGNSDLYWLRADARLRGWVAEHDEAISLMTAGSAKPEFVREKASRSTQPASVETDDLPTRIFWIGTAALFKAGRLRAEGNPAGAWDVLNAVVRASRHIDWAVTTSQGRTQGFTLVQYAREPVADWAKDPVTTVVLLHRALDDLAAAEAMTPPLSRFYHHEYRNSLEALSNLSPLITLRAQQRLDRGRWHLFTLAPSLEAFLTGEPERSRRVLNLLVASDLSWCDRPIALRPAFAVPRLLIPEPDPTAKAAKVAPTPEELARWADSALITPTLAWRYGELDKWERIDRWSLSQLAEAVAVALFTKDMGHPPASPAEALRRYRPTPGDSPTRDEAEPLP